MKIIYSIFISMLISFFAINNIYAENTNNENKNEIAIEKIFSQDDIYEKNISIDQVFTIDLSSVKEKLEKENNSKILFEWNIQGDNTQNGTIFEKNFETFGEKELNLSIYKISGKDKELITANKFNIFVYKSKITQIFENTLEDKIDSFILKSKESGIFIEKIILNKSQIEKYDFKEKIENNINNNKYLVIWGDKDFIFDILSKLNTQKIENPLDLVLISSFNINILQKILTNFISNKTWLQNAIILDESSKYEILKQPKNIVKLKSEIIKNNYDFVDLNTKSSINNVLFISKFINNLSNLGFSTSNIYLILIIPFLLLGINIFKHLIGLTPTGILIPVAITLLFLKLSFIPTIILILIFIITNILLSKIITKYNLHYTPKITLLTIINIIIFIITINIFITNNLINININDVMLVIFFVLIAEKLINVIVSKEFGEYRNSLINTLIFSIISYIFFSIVIIKTFILAYPELILLLIPIIFIIGRFTGLRVTEYFRFKEIIKSVEE